MAKAIGTLGMVDTVTVGGRVFTDMTNLIFLASRAAGAPNETVFRKHEGTTGFTPSGSNVFRCYALKMQPTSTTQANINLNYSNTDIGLNAAAGSFVSPVYFISDSNSADNFATNGYNTLSTSIGEWALNFKVPNGKYMGFRNSGAGTASVLAYGYEATS